jgi:hypothetical protein
MMAYMDDNSDSKRKQHAVPDQAKIYAYTAPAEPPL